MSQFGNISSQAVHAAEPVRGGSPGPSHITRVSDSIQVMVGVLNGLIGLRFLLRLVGAANPLAEAVYSVTSPFLRLFRGLTGTSSVNGTDIEFFALIAILVYAMVGWILVQLVWIVLAGRK